MISLHFSWWVKMYFYIGIFCCSFVLLFGCLLLWTACSSFLPAFNCSLINLWQFLLCWIWVICQLFLMQTSWSVDPTLQALNRVFQWREVLKFQWSLICGYFLLWLVLSVSCSRILSYLMIQWLLKYSNIVVI